MVKYLIVDTGIPENMFYEINYVFSSECMRSLAYSALF